MTVSEACAVNTILKVLLDEQLPRPTLGHVRASGEILAKKANKVLSAGISPEEWNKKWRARVTP